MEYARRLSNPPITGGFALSLASFTEDDSFKQHDHYEEANLHYSENAPEDYCMTKGKTYINFNKVNLYINLKKVWGIKALLTTS